MKNLTMLTDLYELTMMQGYFKTELHEKQACYDLFFRHNPFDSAYTIAAGLEQALDYIKNISFQEEDLDYLKSTGFFSEDFLEYLRDFKFRGEIWAIKEGTVVFPHEPIMRIKANTMEAQFVETTLLNIINHQCLIATKASRIAWAAGEDNVADFGLRRAQGPDAGIYGSRAAYIGGCSSTSNTMAGEMFGIPVLGTHAHSWVMSFDDEYTAFKKYMEIYPKSCTLLVDTYDTLESGVPNAIRVFDEHKDSLGSYGIRLDSGDLSYLSKSARAMLDAAGHEKAYITATSDLDEHFIASLKMQGAKIDAWGVGTKLITAYDCPALGGVYKLCAEYENREIIPKIKISENPDKITNPGVKKVYRFYDKITGKMKVDLIALEEESLEGREEIRIHSPNASWKQMTLRLSDYRIEPLLELVYKDCKAVLPKRRLKEIKEHCHLQLEALWEEYRRLINPHVFPVDLSECLLKLKYDMIVKLRGM